MVETQIATSVRNRGVVLESPCSRVFPTLIITTRVRCNSHLSSHAFVSILWHRPHSFRIDLGADRVSHHPVLLRRTVWFNFSNLVRDSAWSKYHKHPASQCIYIPHGAYITQKYQTCCEIPAKK
jgi:hypothetical protein